MEASIAGTHVTLSVAQAVAPPGSAGTRPAKGSPRARSLEIRSPLLGRPNAWNIAAATAAALGLGVSADAIGASLMTVRGVPGRFERLDEGQSFTVLIDYAHTDDALKNLLVAVRDLRPSRVLTVFGCGGDRDRSKRPLMGAAAAGGSDIVFVTSDNPRSEDPMAIIREILPGVRRSVGDDPRGRTEQERCVVIPDRKEAIRRAVSSAQQGDCVVIAGKGHETYQVLRERTVPFDDRQVARDALARLAGAGGKR
jgi:UDP-N-acetylmuramoyl-L-alanyl-D-glutamate--2,6-diaminopimelate ligase